jgi:glutamate synthase (ferredoxin)
MSGGIAYVYDEGGVFPDHCNQSMCELGPVDGDEEQAELKATIERHVEYTGSDIGRQILASWDSSLERFVKVLPTDYKRVQEALERARESGLSGDEAVMEAFEANKADASRAGGN